MKIKNNEIKNILNLDVIQSRIDGYLEKRYGGDKDEWTEEYKWEIIPEAHKEFIKEKDIVKKIEILQKHNPPTGSFVHWSNLDDLKKFSEKDSQLASKLLKNLLEGKGVLSARIDLFINEIEKKYKKINLGTPLFGYLFAVYDYKKYPVYKGSIFNGIKRLVGKTKEWSSMSIGEKYETFTTFCYEMGATLKPKLKPVEIRETVIKPGFTALDGQDFFYVLNNIDEDHVNFWWVNQGGSYTEEMSNEYLWAPLSGGGPNIPFHWENMKKVKEGDIIFQYANKNLRGVAIAKGPGYNYLNESEERWDKNGIRVDIDHYDLELISIDALKNYKSSFSKALKNIKGPFDVNGGVKQGYLFGFNLDAAKIVREIYNQPFPEKIENIIKGHKDQLVNKREVQYWTISPGEEAKMWDEFYNKGIMGLGWDDLGDFKKYKTKDDFKVALKKIYKYTSDVKNNKAACFEFAYKMQPGDFLFVKKGVSKIIGYGEVNSDYIYDETRDEYKSIRKVKWITRGEWELKKDEKPAIKTLTNITKYTDYVEKLKKIINQNNNMKTISKNSILYGPPGTGKTYQAMKIAEELLSKQSKKETKEEVVQKTLQEATWLEVIGIIMISRGKEKYKVPEMVSDEIAQAVAKTKGRTSKLNPSFWGLLQFHSNTESTTVNFSKRSGLNLFDKDESSAWFLTENGKDYFKEERIDKFIDQLKNIKPDIKDWREYYDFITFHQSYSYEEFIEGIRPVLDEEDSGDLQYKLKDGIFKKMCKKAEQDSDNKYLIIIDEINRGNISKIFGELITLVEEDKRQGGENEIKVTLPYSNEAFSVPSNLYILGTMNTADRSIALLDVALRRRFKFKELMPEYNKTGLNNIKVGNLNVGDLLKKINKKISIMIDRDHQIGHSYFLKLDKSGNKKETLHSIWYDEVIPLLQEYFYNDWEKIGLILGKYKKDQNTGFIDIKSESSIKSLFEGDNGDEFSDVIVGDIHKYDSSQLINALLKL